MLARQQVNRNKHKNDYMTASTHDSMLAAVNWRRVGHTAAREQVNREQHAPVVSAYRWWARRPHSVMGAVLDAAVARYGHNLKVADPFSGGGTVTFEAVRRGLSAYAQDLYPWPATGLAVTLTRADVGELSRASQMLLQSLEPHRREFVRPDGRELSHVLRVRLGECAGCSGRIHLFPEMMVSLSSRSLAQTQAFYGCAVCGSVSRRRAGVRTFRCDACDASHSVSDWLNRCPHCRDPLLLKPLVHGDASWRAVLVQEVVLVNGRSHAQLRPVERHDPVDAKPGTGSHAALSAPIGPGKETRRLIDAGYECWGDLYTHRQVDFIVDALSHVGTLPFGRAIRDRLAYAVLGLAEMPAFLSRWDRFHLKPFEGIANHRYADTTLAVESNPLAPCGRGTLPRRLAASRRALQWLTEQCEALPAVRRLSGQTLKRQAVPQGVVVATGSSARQALPDGSIQLALTDPPYFDDVQYGELARLFHAWLSVYMPVSAIDERQEAVPNVARGMTAQSYEAAIGECLTETRRTLARNGRLVLTFHNTKMAAWQALAGALHRAGFEVRALAVVRAENAGDHCKQYAGSMLDDLVLECRARGRRPVAPELAFRPRTEPEKNLAAIGLALAAGARSGATSRLPEHYGAELQRLGAKHRLVR